MAPPLVMLPSPLLGPAVWAPDATRLSGLGWEVTIASPPAAGGPRSPRDVLDGLLTALPVGRELTLVPHSNAGLYVPQLTTHRNVVGYVFVDAGLPHGYGTVPVAPPPLLRFLRAKANRDGVLPPWTRWWDETEVTALFPNAEVRQRVEREQPRLPLSYFEQTLPATPGWDTRAGTYLGFGDTYASEQHAPARRGWPVRVLPGQHLHMLIDPDQVARAVHALLTDIGHAPGIH
jgi:hypothetical protein